MGRRENEQRVKVMIATPLEEELVRDIEDVDSRVDILYKADLLPPPRYPSDHKGEPGFCRRLVEALKDNRLRGAALDVFREEPLP